MDAIFLSSPTTVYTEKPSGNGREFLELEERTRCRYPSVTFLSNKCFFIGHILDGDTLRTVILDGSSFFVFLATLLA